ncbi:uncharacterized protein ACLA_081580 [Aspergillus clavatus NRRL 1]|uniref:G protein gamma domain-containing protein n=1 Tax=Aspergillus clavatus (strain ATCC 1007 / CBS 513.65 / DSM 816 / NCTC 3887 / NRRL 1 / QM 1276 / 107) TaxID=344612 RepID=A1CT31_ASPCL|nr:uncharacterized protein ACLA_081580 [Aspergillus clavatus NRRL 1]EAW06468.1 conserved hypothetical protein [Aspergillus clavatus NRRL 1]
MTVRVTRSQSRKTSVPHSESHSPESCKRKNEFEDPPTCGNVHRVSGLSSCKTPQRQNKRVRISDPGPQLQNCFDYSTGLTPALLRTSFEDSGDTDPVIRTPSRRRSAPLARPRYLQDPSFPVNRVPAERVVQFTPLRQILDPRTQRRLRRIGLSDEINHIEREKRETAYYEKTLQSLLRERDALKQELELTRATQTEHQSSPPEHEAMNMSPQTRIEHLEAENDRLREKVSFSSFQHADDQCSVANSDTGTIDTIIINDSAFEGDTILMSNSPDIHAFDGDQCPIPNDLSQVLDQGTAAVDYTQLRSSDNENGDDLRDLSLDLEAARREKRNLFDSCRAHSTTFDGTELSQHLHQSSPPPDFVVQVVSALTTAVGRASDAVGALNSAADELSSLGFSGQTVYEILTEIRHRFRAARLSLERAVPGETANAGLVDGSATLSALVDRVELLVKDLGEERNAHRGSLGREKALRGQFDTLLVRNEAASRRIQGLEETITSSASDMLHTRVRMQELEREGNEQSVSIDRLNEALKKYCEEVKGLEALVNQLETEKIASREQHNQRVSQLEAKIASDEKARAVANITIAEREERIRQLEETVQLNQIRSCDLTAKVESLEKERHDTLESLKQKLAEQLQHHENEIGLMNVRVSELTTSLEAAKSEAENLRRSNAGLEEQLQLEMEAKADLLDKWAADQARSFAFMKETVNSERRKARVRAANWELQSDDLQSDGTMLPSEPITPVSMARFVDVEVGRGKHRKRLDSGIGILTEDDLLNDDGDNGREPPLDINLLPSDPPNL